MAFGILSALAAGANLIGGILTNKSNENIAEDNRAFQADQRATQYQTAVKDMEAAGLNPMLAYQQGGAGSSPGSTAVMQNPASGLLDAVSSAMGAQRLKLELENMKKTNEQIDSSTELNKALKVKAGADALYSSNSAAAAATNNQVLQQTLPGAINRANIEGTWFGKAMNYLDRITGSIGKVFGGSTSYNLNSK